MSHGTNRRRRLNRILVRVLRDGTTIPNVVAVNSISKNAPVIETKSMTPDGKYVNQKMYGPNQSGEMSISVLNTGDQAVTGWIMSGLGGDQASARKTAKLLYKDTTGSTVLTMEFTDVLVSSIDYGSLSAGEANAIQMTINLSFVDMTTT